MGDAKPNGTALHSRAGAGPEPAACSDSLNLRGLEARGGGVSTFQRGCIGFSSNRRYAMYLCHVSGHGFSRAARTRSVEGLGPRGSPHSQMSGSRDVHRGLSPIPFRNGSARLKPCPDTKPIALEGASKFINGSAAPGGPPHIDLERGQANISCARWSRSRTCTPLAHFTVQSAQSPQRTLRSSSGIARKFSRAIGNWP